MAQPLYLENISDKGMERPSGQDDQHNFKRQSPQERAWSGRGGSGKKQVVVTMVKIHGMKFFKVHKNIAERTEWSYNLDHRRQVTVPFRCVVQSLEVTDPSVSFVTFSALVLGTSICCAWLPHV